MRIINYFNLFAAFCNLLFVFAAVWMLFHRGAANRRAETAASSAADESLLPLSSPALRRAFLLLLLLIGCFLRLFLLTSLPDGLNQDEASIGYNAFCLANYGVDQNGYPWPVYPITWGSGGGSPLLVYFCALSARLFGSSVFSLRLVPALFGMLTLLIFYFLLRELLDPLFACIGLLVLCVSPWHIMISRWTLDCNAPPLWICLALYFLVLGIKRGRTVYYCIAAALHAICLYSYGSANIIIPFHLLLICIYCMRRRVLSFRGLLCSGAVFALFALPLACFYAVNYAGLPPLTMPWFSFQKFTSSHFGSVFLSLDASFPAALLANLKELLRYLTFGYSRDADMLCNYVPGYWILYQFTFPITILGLVSSVRSLKTRKTAPPVEGAVMLSLFAASFLFSLLIQIQLNRMVILFVPLTYYYVRGLRALWRARRSLFAGALVLLLMGAVSFTHDYFLKYNAQCSYLFMPGYGDAMVFADALADEKAETARVISTYDNLASPFMITLFYTQTPPDEFLRTMTWADETAEFRVALSFGHFVFGLPDDVLSDKYADDVLVVSHAEEALFNPARYEIREFGNYAVVTVR